jgi:hypothetical protein
VSDRSNIALLDAARVASNPDVVAPATVVAQRDQRFWSIALVGGQAAAINVNTNYTWYALRFDRAVKITAVSFPYPLVNIASNATNYSVVSLVSAADGVTIANATTVATFNTANTVVTSYTPTPFTLVAANVTLAANTTVAFTTAQNGGANSQNLANAAMLQFTWQEV